MLYFQFYNKQSDWNFESQTDDEPAPIAVKSVREGTIPNQKQQSQKLSYWDLNKSCRESNFFTVKPVFL